ncbi:MAG: DUF3179 domain-containing protein [Rhodospirillaceae bacterium]|nr:DUF3179 domain-containing protein [Rhodospirillaceae bacterium]MBT7510982.1 DUF3179 domain-containing protein [Rhodospirillaceae bacterium]
MISARLRRPFRRSGPMLAAIAMLLSADITIAADGVQYWSNEFPNTDFTKHSIEFSEIRSDGATKDSIPTITQPTFIPARKVRGLGPLEPVLSVVVGSDARAYPLRIMLWHEIVNDRVGDTPLLVSYCPLCNSGVVFERVVESDDGRQNLVFGNTGRLRHFDMVMYDHMTGSWWQQFTGEAIIGELTGAKLKPLASRVEAFGRFVETHPDGRVLVPNRPKARPYGTTPYVRMDTSPGQGLEIYGLPKGVAAFDRVVVVGNEAWTLKLLREKGIIERDDLVLSWIAGQNSVHDTKFIAYGRDVGNVIVKRLDAETDEWEDAVHDVTFAFAFKAFVANGTLHMPEPKKED